MAPIPKELERMNALAKASNNCKLQKNPVVREDII
jgi:hypothetical protein